MRPERVLVDNDSSAQLQMVWPEHLLHVQPYIRLPSGYTLRTYLHGDETRFFKLMELAGWPGWNEDVLQPWLLRILPEGWFVAVHEQSGEIVASAMALRSETYSSGGELGWLAADPTHIGKGLGMAVSAAVTARFIDEGYLNIHLYTEDFRLAALKTYLKLGYVPFPYASEMLDRWRNICDQLQWPFTPWVWNSPESSSA
jgi:mycothiol synthase